MVYTRLAVILGDSLFPNHSLLGINPQTLVFMAEDYQMCTIYQFHKHKLIFYLSSMRHHAEQLNHDVYYAFLTEKSIHKSYEDKLSDVLNSNQSIREIVTYRPKNKGMRKRLKSFATDNDLSYTEIANPNFIVSPSEFQNYLQSKPRKMQSFYIWQRKRIGLLMNGENKPVGGKWSYDDQNRKKLPKKYPVPSLKSISHPPIVERVKSLVDQLFEDHPGSTSNFWLPTTREMALQWVNGFFAERFKDFGPYEDAIDTQHPFMFHSVLSPLMNAGLINPLEIVDMAVKVAVEYDVPLNSLEGFIRQIVGWREFMKGMYDSIDYANVNYFEHNRKLANCWYTGETGIPPLDDLINQINNYGYAHHIQRLMIASNLMVLCEIHPKEAYRWFMELFVDSANWVMKPNVFGMGLFADGGQFSTKPYISGSNYILKMSNYKKGEWSETWTALYWNFINKHQDFFRKQARMSFMVRQLEKFGDDKLAHFQLVAKEFIEKVTT